jgi:hypothetical protein
MSVDSGSQNNPGTSMRYCCVNSRGASLGTACLLQHRQRRCQRKRPRFRVSFCHLLQLQQSNGL